MNLEKLVNLSEMRALQTVKWAGKVEFYFNVLFIDAVILYRKSLNMKEHHIYCITNND